MLIASPVPGMAANSISPAASRLRAQLLFHSPLRGRVKADKLELAALRIAHCGNDRFNRVPFESTSPTEAPRRGGRFPTRDFTQRAHAAGVWNPAIG